MFVLQETAKRVSESDSTLLAVALAVILVVSTALFVAVLVESWKK